MLDIDTAIKHCLEVAEQNDFEKWVYDELNRSGYEEYRNNCEQCAADHRQLAEWLQELKQWRENPFKMIKDICAAHEWCPDCQLSDHCIRASGWALSYPSEWEVE